MATGNFDLDKGYNAAAAITKYRAVKFTASETVGPVTDAADVFIGFAQFDVTAGEITRGKGASVRLEGITEAEAAGAIAVGELCTLTDNGRVQAANTGDRLCGQCVGHPSTNAGDRISLSVDNDGALAL